jgi:hypothetical protein
MFSKNVEIAVFVLSVPSLRMEIRMGANHIMIINTTHQLQKKSFNIAI